MIDLMGIAGGGGGGRFTIDIETPRSSLDPGSTVVFDVDYTDITEGLTLYWTLGGDFTSNLIEGGEEGMSGEVFIEESDGTFTVEIGTTIQENLDALKTMWLEVRILSREGNIIGESSPVTMQYDPHPIGQQVFIELGETKWTVPDNVLFITAICVGGGEASPQSPYSRGGAGADLRWRNRIPVTPGEELTVVVGEGGQSSNDFSVRHGKDTLIKRGDEILLIAKGGGNITESSKTDYEWVPPERVGLRWRAGFWRIRNISTATGGGDGGSGAPGGEEVGPGGGGGAGGYGIHGSAGVSGGDGGNRSRFSMSSGTSPNIRRWTGGRHGQQGAGGGGAYYFTSNNNSHHALPGGGVGLLGQGSSGRGAENNDPSVGGGGGSGGNDGSWSESGIYGGGGRGNSSIAGPFPGGVNGGNGAARILWGIGRQFPNTHTGNL